MAGVASAFNEFELEGLHELESEGESEFELGELGELESPEMFGWDDVTRWAGNQWNAVNTPGTWQRRAALAAGKAAAVGVPTAVGARYGGPAGGVVGGILGSGLASALPDKELYGEFEFGELENELSPIRRIYADAIMEHMAHEALEAESEQEVAEGFLPLIPMLAAKALPMVAKLGAKFLPKLLPKVSNVISRVTPRLMRGVSNVARTLFRNRRTRPLIRAVPTIARRTINTIARQTAAGRPVSPVTAQRVLAAQTQRLLASPQQTAAVIRRANTLDRHYHRITGTPIRAVSGCNCGVAAAPSVTTPPVITQATRPCCSRCGRLQ
jgi:hypothetical protein